MDERRLQRRRLWRTLPSLIPIAVMALSALASLLSDVLTNIIAENFVLHDAVRVAATLLVPLMLFGWALVYFLTRQRRSAAEWREFDLEDIGDLELRRMTESLTMQQAEFGEIIERGDTSPAGAR